MAASSTRLLRRRPLPASTTHAISGAASRYGDELLRLYAWQAFHFARLAVAALTARVGAASISPPLDAEPLPISRLHADPTTLPVPPTPTSDVPIGHDLLPAYAAVLDAVDFGRGDPDHPPENLDRGTPYDPAIDI